MRILNINQYYFSIEPDTPTESNKLKKFPGFQRVKGKFLIPKKSWVVQDLIGRFKKVHRDPISAPGEFRDYMTSPDKLLDIPEDFPWVSKPYPHQELALRYLYTHGSAGLLLEPGLGKTYVVLNYIKLAEFRKSLIICPKALLFVWEDEVQKHRPDLKVHVMKSTAWSDKLTNAEANLSKWESMDQSDPKVHANILKYRRDIKRIPQEMDADLSAAQDADIIVINYEKVVPGLNLLQDMEFEFMAIDEGLIKDVKTNRTKAIHKLSSSIPYKVIMSGTLVNNGPLDIFSPVKIIEPALVGGGYGAFEHYYARIAKARNGRRFVAGVGKRQTDEIRDILASCSIIMTKDEWLQLPDKHFHRITVPMSEAQEVMYNDLQSNHICEVGDRYLQVDNPLTVACYLNQIANGFVYLYDVEIDDFMDEAVLEKGERETIFIESGKKSALKGLLEGDLKGKKFILWYNLQAEYEQICEVLEGIEFMSIRGGSKNTGDIVHSFNDSGTCQVLVCQSQSVNYGITVLGRNPEDLDRNGVEILPDFDTSVYNHVFWSLGWSLERYTQQQDRSHRIGQTQDVHYWILATECGIEDLIWERLDKKEEIRDSILVDYIKSL